MLSKCGCLTETSEWVVRLPAVVSALNGEVTRLTGKKPAEAIKEAVYFKHATSYHSPVGVREKWIPSSAIVLYLYKPG